MSKKDARIYHETDPNKVKKRLSGFYGQVARRENELIEKSILGNKVLDIGSGYGFLLYYLCGAGYKAEGLEPCDKEINYSKNWFKIHVTKGSIYRTNYPDNSFETTILKDTIFHLDIEKALPEIKRITSKRCIVFMGNTGFLIRLVKIFLRHKEFIMKTAREYIDIFESYGFRLNKLSYMDFIAFPLSGGFISYPLIPKNQTIWNIILKFENMIKNILNTLKIDRYFAFRACLVFDLKE